MKTHLIIGPDEIEWSKVGNMWVGLLVSIGHLPARTLGSELKGFSKLLLSRHFFI